MNQQVYLIKYNTIHDNYQPPTCFGTEVLMYVMHIVSQSAMLDDILSVLFIYRILPEDGSLCAETCKTFLFIKCIL